VASVGDVKGDGYGDVVVGAYYYDNGESNEWRAYVYHGNGADGTTPLARTAPLIVTAAVPRSSVVSAKLT
jgi:hypothetical protein